MKSHTLIFIASLACAFGQAVHGQAPKAKETAAEKFEREKLGNVPIALHGRVLDQDNQPLDGVTVSLKLEVGYMRTLTEGHTRWDVVKLTTNPNGRFDLPSRKAGSISDISLTKDGYEGSAKNPSRFHFFQHGTPHHVPDPQNPVVFRMWKNLGAEPMVVQDRWIRIPYDGTPVSFDLIKGEKIQNQDQPADIRVTLKRTPLTIIRGKQKFDWHATIEAIDGGLIESESEFMYLAPEHGYKPTIEIQVNAGDPKWDADRKVSFYIHNRNGQQYGRAILEFNTGSDQPTTGFGFQSYINPAGSRVLEYDVFKRIIPGRQKAK